MSKSYRKLTCAAIIILIVTILLLSVSTFFRLRSISLENREVQIRAAAQLVDSAINKAFLRPHTVAKVMSEDVNMKEMLGKAGTDPEGVENEIKDYLSSFRNGLGYKVVFAVCNASGAYYTYDGITSYIDRSFQGNSAWYGELMESGKTTNLDVDVEESTDWALSVFANQLVYDSNKKLLGVCGVGVEMTQLQSLIELYERIYKVKIDVTDSTGLIQIDSDVEKIEKDVISLPSLDIISDGEYYYEKLDGGDRVITYMEDIDMYLVVANTGSEFEDIISAGKLQIGIVIIGIASALGLMLWADKYKNEEKIKQ